MRLLVIAVGLLCWAAALFGVLQIGAESEFASHAHGSFDICGPWGCGPPVQAIIGWQGFWFVLIAPSAGLLSWFYSANRVRQIGVALLGTGVLAMVGICIYQAVTWLPTINEGQPTYFIQRCLFTIVTATDLPTIPVTLSGLLILSFAAIKRGRKVRLAKEGDSSASAVQIVAKDEATQTTNQRDSASDILDHDLISR